MKLPKKTMAAGAVGTLFLTAACGSEGNEEVSPSADDYAIDGTFTYALNGDPGTLSPLVAPAAAARLITPIAYDHLLHFDTNGDPVPWLAESWEESPTSVTYTLKEGITCSDGSELTAQTVADNFAFVEDEANGSPARGAQIPAGISVEADNATREFTITTTTASSFLLFQTGTLDIVCQSVLDDPDSAAAATNGTGLYEMVDAVPNDSYTFERRDAYTWGYDETTADTEGLPKTIVVRIVSNESTLTNLLLSGEINAGNVNGPDVARLESAGLESAGTPWPVGEMYFNQSNGRPTADLRVRQALTMALDLDDLTQVISGGRGQRLEGMVTLEPNPCGPYNSTEGLLPDTDPAKAASLLDEAGWSETADGTREKDGQPLSLTLVYDNTTDGQKAAAELTQMKWQELGATVNLKGGDNSFQIANTIGTADSASWDVTWITLKLLMPSSLTSFVSGPTPLDGNNFTHAINAEYEALVAQASELQAPEACEVWEQAEEALIRDLTVLPYAVQPQQTYLKNAILTENSRPGAGTGPISGPAIRLLP